MDLIKSIYELAIGIAFMAILYFGGDAVYSYFQKESLKMIAHGQSDIYIFTQSMTGKTFDLE